MSETVNLLLYALKALIRRVEKQLSAETFSKEDCLLALNAAKATIAFVEAQK